MKRLLALTVIATGFGCTPKLDHRTTFAVDQSGGKQTILDPIRSAQKIKVDIQATGGPIDVFVYLEKNKEAAQKESFAKGGPNLLVDKRKIDAAQFEVAIPAAETTIIDVQASTPKKADVTLKVTN